MNVTFTYTRDDDSEVAIRAQYHRADRARLGAPGHAAYVEVYEANAGSGWVPISHIDGLEDDIDAIEQAAWDVVESRLAHLHA